MLGRVDLLASLDDRELEHIAAECVTRSLESHQEIVGHLDETRDVFFILEGSVRAEVHSVDGTPVSYRDIRAGGMFGEYAAIDGAQRSASVVALTRSRVAIMPAASFWRLLETHPRVAGTLLRSLASQLRSLTGRIFEFSTLAVRNRIHAELLRLARDGTGDGNRAVIEPAPTHAEIASRISTHREAVTRELKELARSGLVEQRGRRLIVKDVPALARMVEDVTGFGT